MPRQSRKELEEGRAEERGLHRGRGGDASLPIPADGATSSVGSVGAAAAAADVAAAAAAADDAAAVDDDAAVVYGEGLALGNQRQRCQAEE